MIRGTMAAALAALLVMMVGSRCASAQFLNGEILTTNDVSDLYDLVHLGGGTSTASTPPLSHTARAIYWDPQIPGDLYLAGYRYPDGILSRVRLGAGAPIVTQIAVLPNHRTPIRMFKNPNGSGVVYFDSYTDEIYRVDLNVGSTPVALTAVGSNQYWGNSMSCGTVDPSTGDLYVGTSSGDVYRVQSTPPPAAPSIALVASGVTSSIADLHFDPLRPGRLVVCAPSQIIALDLMQSPPAISGLVSSTSGLPGSFMHLRTDPNGDFVAAVWHPYQAPDLWKIPNTFPVPSTGLTPQFYGQSHGLSQGITDLHVFGSGGAPFRLTMSAIPGSGSGFIQAANIPPNTTRGYSLASFFTPYLPGQGPLFGIHPDSLTFSALLFPTAAPGNFWHWTNTPGVWPRNPLVLPLGAVPGSPTIDLVLLAIDGSGQLVGHTNVARATF